MKYFAYIYTYIYYIYTSESVHFTLPWVNPLLSDRLKKIKKEGLLKRLANINKANDLHNLRYINTNIRPRDIDYYRLNKNKFDTRRFYEAYNKLESFEEKFFMINEFYKKIENFKNNDNILSDDINKKTRILNNTSKVYNNLLGRYKDEYFEKYKQYNEEWEKNYDYKNFNDLTDDKIFNIDLSWMYNPKLYDEISQDVLARYSKNRRSNELESIQTFLDNITSDYIKNKKDALEEFKTVKNNAKSENLKDVVKELERAIFGYDYDDNEEPKYEESIAERTKLRRENKETDKKDASRTFAPPDPDRDDSNKFTEMYYTPYSSIFDDEKTEKVYEEGYDKEGYDGAGFNEYGFNKDGFNEDGFNEDGFNKDGFNEDRYDKWGFNKDGFNKNGKKDKKFNKLGYNINWVDRKGLDKNGYNINGYNTSGYDS